MATGEQCVGVQKGVMVGGSLSSLSAGMATGGSTQMMDLAMRQAVSMDHLNLQSIKEGKESWVSQSSV
eukprot:1161063-Pelagomonas_calceolata.AAC.7